MCARLTHLIRRLRGYRGGGAVSGGDGGGGGRGGGGGGPVGGGAAVDGLGQRSGVLLLLVRLFDCQLAPPKQLQLVLFHVRVQPLVLDQDLPLEPVGRGQRGSRAGREVLQRLLQQHLSEDLVAVLGHLVLLVPAAVVLEGEDDRVVGRDKGAVPDGVDDVLEGNVGAHGLPVGDDGLVVRVVPVPAVQLDAAAPGQQALAVHLHAGLAAELASGQVRVVAGIDVVVRQGLVHVLVDVQAVQKDGGVLVRHQVVGQALLRDHVCWT